MSGKWCINCKYFQEANYSFTVNGVPVIPELCTHYDFADPIRGKPRPVSTVRHAECKGKGWIEKAREVK